MLKFVISVFLEGASDFEPILPISVLNSADIRLFTVSDRVALEYDDRILLRFTPSSPGFIPGLESVGEYLRDTATVNITDSNRKHKQDIYK